MIENIKKISNLVKDQFPSFYKEEGRDFINFVVAYYQWLEERTGGKVTILSRELPEISDIDQTRDEFFVYFYKKFLPSIPLQNFGDKRMLIKHAVDLYRTKGSIDSIQLLFRLLYNEEVSIYFPRDNILRLSDGKWVIEYYLEIEELMDNKYYEGQIVTGLSSNATALVERYEVRLVANRRIHLFLLSNISGQFIPGEILTTPGVDPINAPKIKGSPTSVTVIEGGRNHEVGDEFVSGDLLGLPNGSAGQGIKARVTEIDTYAGIIEFTLVDGGSGYTSNAVINITTGSNTSGTGADFIITEFGNTSIYEYNNDLIQPYVANTINTIGLTNVISDTFPTLYETIGTITKIRTTNPGEGYDGSVTITITDPLLAPAGIPDGKGGFKGNNAIVTGIAAFGEGIVTGLKVTDTGFGFNQPDITVNLYNSANTSEVIETELNLGGIGYTEGSWRGTDGFLNSDRYIQDSYYYQQFSYEIQSSRTFDKYIDILRKTVHPAGSEPFGKVVIESFNKQGLLLSDFTITSGFFNEWDDSSTWVDTSYWREIAT